MKRLSALPAAALGLACLAVTGTSSAIVVTLNANATDLVHSLLGDSKGMTNISATLSDQGRSTGIYTNASGTYGIGDGIVISTGDVRNYGDGPNTTDSQSTALSSSSATAAQEALLSGIDGGSLPHYDVTELTINFDLLPGYDSIYVNITWGSEDFPEFIGGQYIDPFGLFVNGINIAFVGGLPINVNNPNMMAVPGTELDGLLAGSTGTLGPYVHKFSVVIGDGATGNTLKFIIADRGDMVYDSTAYISKLSALPSSMSADDILDYLPAILTAAKVAVKQSQ